MALPDLIHWVGANPIPAFVVCLTILIGVGGAILFFTGIVFVEMYAPYDELIHFEKDEKTFLVLGRAISIEGMIQCIGSLFVFSVVMKKAICLQIYFLVFLIFSVHYLLLAFLGSAIEVARVGFSTIEKEMDLKFNSEYGVNIRNGSRPGFLNDGKSYKNDDENSPEVDNNGPKLNVSKIFDVLHKNLECCGSNGTIDFRSFEELPKSCCKSLSKEGDCQMSNAYHNGCKFVLVEYLRDFAKLLAGVYGFLLLVTAVTMVYTSIIVCRCCRPTIRGTQGTT